jgi:hypothetical protein
MGLNDWVRQTWNDARRMEVYRAARRAIASNDPELWSSALEELPPNGRKAEQLRADLSALLQKQREPGEQLRLTGRRMTKYAQTESESAPRRSLVHQKRQDVQIEHSSAIIDDGYRFEYQSAELGRDRPFFEFAAKGSEIVVTINTSYEYWSDLELTTELKPLITSWVRMELSMSPKMRHRLSDTRMDWSRVLRRHEN